MIRPKIVEKTIKKYMPTYFACISNEQLEKVKGYIQTFTRHSFSATTTGSVLDMATSSQGKMIRPRLVLMSAAFGPLGASEAAYKLAAIIEMTHLASLIHDDVVDDSPLRRGKPSVQYAYGKHAAVYAGDFLMSRISYHLMSEGLNQSGMVLSRTVEAMCAGEIGQARHRYDAEMTIDEYLRHIHGKTVALFQACCRIGAMESGCSDDMIDRLEGIGECLGYMFQLRDDLLDFLPDSSTIGKASHQDFREGIYTLPVLLTREQPGGALALQPYFEKSKAHTLTEEDIFCLEERIAAFGGMEQAWDVIRAYQKQAVSLIYELPRNKVTTQLLSLVQKLGAAQV